MKVEPTGPVGVSLGKIEKGKPELRDLVAVVGNGQEAISLG